MVAIDLGKHHLVERLVEDAGYAQHQDGPGILEHALEQRPVKPVLDVHQFLPKEEGHQSRAGQVDEEGITHSYRGIVDVAYHIRIAPIERRQGNEVEQVQRNVEHNEQQLERRKLERLALIPQIGKRDALERVERDHDRHHTHILGMGAIAHPARNARQESQHKQDK